MSVFCNENNVSSCLRLLSAELDILGYPEVTYNESNIKLSIVNLVNLIWAFVDSSKKYAVKIGELNEQIITLSRRNACLEEKKSMQCFIVGKEKDKYVKLESKLSKMSEEKEKILRELKDMKMELQSVQSELNKQLQQHKHEIQKKECLIDQLEAKLFRLLNLEDIPKSEKTFKCDTSINSDIELYSNYVLNLRNNIELLVNENVCLRNSIVNIYLSILKSNNSDTKIKEELLKLPYESVINKIEGDLKLMIDKNKLSTN